MPDVHFDRGATVGSVIATRVHTLKQVVCVKG
jgi:RNA-splicing ligase RtcB